MSEPGLPERLKEKVHKVHSQDGCRGLLQRFNMAQDVKGVVLASITAARKCIEEEEEVRRKRSGMPRKKEKKKEEVDAVAASLPLMWLEGWRGVVMCDGCVGLTWYCLG